MLSTSIETLLVLIQGLLPTLGRVASADALAIVDQVLAALVKIVPIIAANASNFLQPVKNIIAALQASGNVTADQMAQLQALDAQVDAAFDAAASSAGA
jgi:hypothetical protein